MNLVLIGLRGSGKTTVGRLLAERLGWPFVDTDGMIVARAGKSIRQIFQQHGETHFRDLETEAIRQAAAGDRQVISAGGGALQRSGNRDALLATGRCIWLDARPETLWQRVSTDPRMREDRPDLTPLGGLDEMRLLAERRAPGYRAAAHFKIDTDALDPAAAAAAIVAWLQPHGGSPIADCGIHNPQSAIRNPPGEGIE